MWINHIYVRFCISNVWFPLNTHFHIWSRVRPVELTVQMCVESWARLSSWGGSVISTLTVLTLINRGRSVLLLSWSGFSEKITGHRRQTSPGRRFSVYYSVCITSSKVQRCCILIGRDERQFGSERPINVYFFLSLRSRCMKTKDGWHRLLFAYDSVTHPVQAVWSSGCGAHITLWIKITPHRGVSQ